jgi:CO/xanthine dehydrogenase Mo-binding subunit
VNASLNLQLSRRAILKAGALTIAFTMTPRSGALAQSAPQSGAASAARTLASDAVDAYFVMNADGSVTLYCGKVDLGQGLRIAILQMAAEELGIGIDKISFVEGDTAATPDQGPTAGSTGIQRGGVQVRQAAATARKALIEMAAERFNLPAAELTTADGMVRPKIGGAGVNFAELLAGKSFDLKLDPKAPLKDPKDYTIVGKPLPRPDVPAKSTDTHTYMQDFSLPGMLHGRVVRPASIGASLVSVDESSIKDFAGVKLVRIKDFLGLVGEDEWTVIKAMRALKCQWSAAATLPPQADVPSLMKAGPFTHDEKISGKGEASPALPADAKTVKAVYYWPMQSHASIGPSCAVADMHADGATV